MVAPAVTAAEHLAAIESTLDRVYRTERTWSRLGVWASMTGAAAIWSGYRAGGAVVMAISVLCQIISWAALRAAHRIEDKRRAVLG